MLGSPAISKSPATCVREKNSTLVNAPARWIAPAEVRTFAVRLRRRGLLRMVREECRVWRRGRARARMWLEVKVREEEGPRVRDRAGRAMVEREWK